MNLSETTEMVSEEQGIEETTSREEFDRTLAQEKRVLAIEDSDDCQDLIKFCLQGTPCSVESAVNGSAALELLYQNEYDLIILDLDLPDADGMTVLQMADKLYEMTKHVVTPFIIFSGVDEIYGRIPILKSFPIVDYIRKPVQLKELKEKILAALAVKPTRN